MLGMMMLIAAQNVPEITPAMTSLAVSTSVTGTCLTTPLQPAVIRLDWTATNYNSATQTFKIYRDGVYITSTTAFLYTLQLAGLVENDSHHFQSITFNYRVDIVRNSDNAVLASASTSATKNYGDCV